jgi:hypothetical protein
MGKYYNVANTITAGRKSWEQAADHGLMHIRPSPTNTKSAWHREQRDLLDYSSALDPLVRSDSRTSPGHADHVTIRRLISGRCSAPTFATHTVVICDDQASTSRFF